MKKKFSLHRILLIFFFLFFSSSLYAGGVLSSPRKVYVIKTNHFEIIFPTESAQTAYYVAENADSLYERARQKVTIQKDFVMPLIISPDSSVLNVKYTNLPYNRIVVYDAAADAGMAPEDADTLLALLYKEIFRAVSCSVRSPFNELVYKWVVGDPYQPVSYLNLPFSFVEAYADIESATVNDAYYQQLLIQAKIEGKFPTWLQTAAIRDIHPGNDLCYAAATGFAAYLMQSRGLEKYAEFWTECGKLHPYFMNGIFRKVYDQSLSEVWKEFKDSVPLPQTMEQMTVRENMSQEVSENDRQGAFENILYTNYGMVWYDSIRHEVDIYDFDSTLKIRQLLFIADDISKLSLSPDGRYISASFTRSKSRPEFKEDITRIFDLKERKFLKPKYPVRDAAFITDSKGKIQLAGIDVQNKNPMLVIYPFLEDEDDSESIYQRFYEKSFERTQIVSSVSAATNGSLVYLLKDAEGTKIVIEKPETQENYYWEIKDAEGQQIVPLSLCYMRKSNVLTFSYYPEEPGSLARAGYITLEQTGGQNLLQNVYIQNGDISGGVYYPVFEGGKLYYCAKKFSHNELRYLSESSITFSEGGLAEVEQPVLLEQPAAVEENSNEENLPDTPLLDVSQKKFGDYNIKTYNPFKYMLNLSFTPLLAIRDITIDEGPVLWPSLGGYIRVDADPMRNTELLVSGGFEFLNLSFVKEFNTVPKETLERYNRLYDNPRRFSTAAYIENSSTPVDISAGAIFNFNRGGDYDFKAIGKTGWKIPVGNILRDMDFSISSMYSSSTEYYDENKRDYHPPMGGWTALTDAYELLELSFSATYSNSHQYGISRYERRGITLEARLYSLWDMYEIDLLQKYRDETKQQIQSGENTELTEVQLENAYQENLLNVSQLNIGFIAAVEIPRLNPLEIKNGWVLSLPTIVSAELMNKTGTALEAKVESLLIGNEIQNGLPFLYLFFSRMGLKGGYAIKLDYDTTTVQLPDIRRKNYLADVFWNTTFSDSLFMIFNTDFQSPVGKLSEIQFNMNLKGEYFIKTQGFKVSFNITAVF